MIGQDGDEKDDELFLDVDTDSDDSILKPKGEPQSLKANGVSLILTLNLTLIFT